MCSTRAWSSVCNGTFKELFVTLTPPGSAVCGMHSRSLSGVEREAPRTWRALLYRRMVRTRCNSLFVYDFFSLICSTNTLPSLDELMFRFEEPTPEARWHRPLFTTTSVGSADHPECLPTPLDAIWDAMTLAQVQPPKAVTAVVRIIAYNFVRHLGHSFPFPY